MTEGGPAADAVRGAFHRTILYKLRTGRRGPELATAVQIERLTGGRVSTEGWLVNRRPKAA